MKEGIVITADENIFLVLENKAKKIGLSNRSLCRLAGIDKDIFTRGKKKEPESIAIIKKLMAVIEAKETEQNSKSTNT